MPMRLWSIVVNHDQTPVVDWGRRMSVGSPSGGGSGGSTTVGSRTVATSQAAPERDGGRFAFIVLLQAIQVGDQVRDLGLREVEVRHHRAWLLGRRVAEPAPEVLVVHVEQAAGEAIAALQMCELR